MSLVPVTAVMILSARLLAQTSEPPQEKPAQHLPPPCVVSGRVVTAAEGTPLKSARVALIPEGHNSKKHMYAGTTDSDGKFLLKDVEQGRYAFVATRAGFVDQHYQAKGAETGATLSLKPGDKVSDVLFRMTLAAVIIGRVTSEDGEAMVRIQVIALRAPNDEEMEDDELPISKKQKLVAASSTLTDDRGQYRIFGLKPGEYYIQVTDSLQPDPIGSWGESYQVQEFLGSEYASAYYPGVSQAGQAQSISVKAGAEAQADVPMRSVKTAEVAGHVIGVNGPAKNAWIQMEPSGEYYGVELRGTSDEKGNFRLKGVPPGSYMIMVFQQGERDGGVEAHGRQKVEVAGENIESLTIVVGRGASVRGRVVVDGPGTPTLSRLVVGLRPFDEDDQLAVNDRVKKDGTFEIQEVQDGNYAVQVWGLEENWYVKSARFGTDDVLAEGLQLEKGAAIGRLELTLSSASAVVEGSVSDDDGPVIGARVRIAPDPETPYTRFRSHHTQTDQAGHFSLAGLPPGKYRLLAKSPASSDGSSYRSVPQAVTLSENDHETLSVKLIKPQD